MTKRTLTMIVCLVLALTMGLGSTLAYLTDTDADVNTMVLGNVEIVQNEQEWTDDKTLLKEFTQDKPLLPYVGEQGWENTEEEGGAYRRFTMENVVDKYVTVTNTGNSDAYVRTIFAFEMGDTTYDELGNLIGVAINKADGAEYDFPGTWLWTEDYVAEIDGKNYNIMVAVHENALAPEETTIPSLLQFYLKNTADNEDVAKLDGNDNGKYDILVLSQAVQAQGFDGAIVALDEAFGSAGEDNKTTVASWFSNLEIGSPGDKNPTNNPPDKEIPSTFWKDNADTSWFDASKSEFVINTAAELAGVAQLGSQLGGKTIKLGADIDLSEHLWSPIRIFTPESSFTLDGDNHTISYLFIQDGSSDAGLFDNCTGTIKNIKIDKANLKTGGRSAIVASRNYGDIINCHVTNSTIVDSYWACGAIASLHNAGNIKDCSINNVTVKSNGGVGGIVGVINETGGTRTVENCQVRNSTIENTGIYGAAYAGAGIAGMVNISNSTVNITGCTVDAELLGKHIAEICGYADSTVTLNIN